MARRRRSEIYSIFGQIEGVVADAMAEEGLVRKIPFEMIPPTQQYDASGNVRAHCAMAMTDEIKATFDRRVAALRA